MTAHRIRTVLSMLSVVVGILAITWTVGLGDMGTEAVTIEIEQNAGREATLQLDLQRTGSPITLTPELRERLDARLARYGLTEASPFNVIDVFVREGARTMRASFNGVTPALSAVRRLPLVAGRWLAPADAHSLAPVIVINRQLLSQLAIDAGSVIGRRLRLEVPTQVDALVVGVAVGRPSDGPEIFGPVDALERWTANVPSSSYYLIRVDPQNLDAVQRLLTFDVAHWNADLRVDIHRVDSAADFKQVITLMQLVMTAVASVALVAGALGIMNLGLVTVRQRTREFGIRRAFGATRTAIFQLVLAETTLTTLLAGLVGVALAALTSPLLARVVGLDLTAIGTYLPVRAALLGLGVAVLVGVLAGVVPARRATAIDVVDAIRQ